MVSRVRDTMFVRAGQMVSRQCLQRRSV